MQPPPSPLESQVRDWLLRQGYPLEMEVARQFQVAGAHVIQSEYYTDTQTGESREVDVVAWWQDNFDSITIRLNLTIECKSSKDKPWVLFGSHDGRLAGPARVSQRAASELAGLALRILGRQREIQDLPIFQLPEVPAYSLTQAMTTGKDICYGAISSVAAAVAAQAREPDHHIGMLGNHNFINILIPVVVTDAKLFIATLAEDSSVDIKHIDSGLLLWRNPIVGKQHTIIHIQTNESLPAFIAMAKASALVFLGLCRGPFRDELTKVVLERENLKLLSRGARE